MNKEDSVLQSSFVPRLRSRELHFSAAEQI